MKRECGIVNHKNFIVKKKTRNAEERKIKERKRIKGMRTREMEKKN